MLYALCSMPSSAGQDCALLIRVAVEKNRDVAQPGRALRSGRRSRWFESSRPDHENRGADQYGQPLFVAWAKMWEKFVV